ncbi:MAG: ATPase [Alphaproteobacteria bacterium]|nr:MAG: ATPase [Alphaproteobacteria bacterium]
MKTTSGIHRPRRFYNEAKIRSLPEGGFAVHLDSRPLKTPAGRPLVVPTRPLSEAIAAEWNALGEHVDPARLPLTGLANTAIDRIAANRSDIVSTLCGFAEADLLCYRADAPEELVRRQQEMWDPPLAALAERTGARLHALVGVLPIMQPQEALERIAEVLDTLDDWRLAVLQAVAGATRSLVLALLHALDAISCETVIAAAHLDETFQNERWGFDEEAMRRRCVIEDEIRDADRFLALLAGKAKD